MWVTLRPVSRLQGDGKYRVVFPEWMYVSLHTGVKKRVRRINMQTGFILPHECPYRRCHKIVTGKHEFCSPEHAYVRPALCHV